MLTFKQFLAEMQASNDNPEYQNIKNAHNDSIKSLLDVKTPDSEKEFHRTRVNALRHSIGHPPISSTASAAELRKSLLEAMSFPNRRRLVKGLNAANKALPGLTKRAVPLGFAAGLIAGQNPEIAAPLAVASPYVYTMARDVIRRLSRKTKNKPPVNESNKMRSVAAALMLAATPAQAGGMAHELPVHSYEEIQSPNAPREMVEKSRQALEKAQDEYDESMPGEHLSNAIDAHNNGDINAAFEHLKQHKKMIINTKQSSPMS